ncbi:V-type proton ATPase 116 kDa subunit a 1-like [Macrosteles quadrilineatus]|uniref:V-type proton ATPase 116 kDa subunit a 1-like n=1 Tax=Macrosteles quadrilineatus TaxID=74068 RepID=UPI0023E2FF26|nr:V-type proton ATPase 116 kDa subunit a 1-like [Macrosteles quadrilineatus]
MGSFFRSEEMTLCQLFLQSEAAYSCVSELGELGLVQFRDLNVETNAFQKKFVNEVRRCEEMERKLRYLEKEIRKHNVQILDTGDNPEAPQPREMVDLEATFEKLESELKEVNQNADVLKTNYLELTELKHILRKTEGFFHEDGELHSSESITKPLELITKPLINEDSAANQNTAGAGQLSFLAGVVLRERIVAFERMLWRACRGNVYMRQASIDTALEDPVTGNKVMKSVFIVFFQGEQLKTRVKKICEGFRATLYPCPETPADRREMAMGVMTRIQDLNTVLGQTQDHRHRVLVAAAKHINIWFIKVRKIKAIYHTLNLFNLDVTQKCLIAECWVPVHEVENIQKALRRGTESSGGAVPPILNQVNTLEEPPTFNRTNKFTKAFQALIDAYGVASYQEVNPAPYTLITFPFLFAVMFGDMGHGLIMTLFAAWMVWKEKSIIAKKSSNEIGNILFNGRYIILLMGLFSVYTGFIYNDIFGKALNIFGSRWRVVYDKHYIETLKNADLDPKDSYLQTPYPIGMDPVWMMAENKIRFFNAYKMKISIIIGVIHMCFGVSLSVWNYKFFKKSSDIFTMFLPQIIFLVCLFLYLVSLMFIKWILYGPTNPVETGPGCAPSILITFINMVLFKENDTSEPCSPWMYPGQKYFQYFLVLISFLCIPWMMLAKPLLMMKTKNLHPQENEDDLENVMREGLLAKKEVHEDMTEVWIIQGIHTIEYVLGSISHTASYLRLWALSLAHGQLSEVLWNMVMNIGLSSSESMGLLGGVVLWAVFAFWAVLTLGILVLMEGLSAFLHTLRLHWVEFQSKFYKGNGYLFTPFSFERILAQSPKSSIDE